MKPQVALFFLGEENLWLALFADQKVVVHLFGDVLEILKHS